MQIRDVMTKDVQTVDAAQPLTNAGLAMRMANVGALPVLNGEQVIGMVTDRDIVVRAVALGVDPNTTPVIEVMTPKVACCFDDMAIWQAALLMEENTVRRLVVTDRGGRMVGMLSYDDLAVLPPAALEPPTFKAGPRISRRGPDSPAQEPAAALREIEALLEQERAACFGNDERAPEDAPEDTAGEARTSGSSGEDPDILYVPAEALEGGLELLMRQRRAPSDERAYARAPRASTPTGPSRIDEP